jgi:hypothetical protein
LRCFVVFIRVIAKPVWFVKIIVGVINNRPFLNHRCCQTGDWRMPLSPLQGFWMWENRPKWQIYLYQIGFAITLI